MIEGIKYDENKPAMDLLPAFPLIEVAKVLEFGAKKYGRFNWMKGMKWSRLTSATLRHIMKWNNGEDVDEESNIHHLAHAACNILFLLDYAYRHADLDDRWIKEIKNNKC